jgi:ADP-L-glycero-D-manno-heptose 6-epimerase
MVSHMRLINASGDAHTVHMILVTGGAGFIGSQIVHVLAKQAHAICVLDDLAHGAKWRNLQGITISRWFLCDQVDEALACVPDAIIHMGAISTTTHMDGDAIIRTNFQLSQKLWDWCTSNQKPFIYASSASTYGDGSLGFNDDEKLIPLLRPLNLYGWSKQLFDLHVHDQASKGLPTPPQWAGLKFFNVYGAHEQHKHAQASVIYQQWCKLRKGDTIQLFRSTHPQIPDGEQKRDFVWVHDCVKVISWLLHNHHVSGIFNVGSGTATSFNQLANCMLHHMHMPSNVEYVAMPENLVPHYQNYTCAHMDKLHAAGYNLSWTSMHEGVKKYVTWLNQHT